MSDKDTPKAHDLNPSVETKEPAKTVAELTDWKEKLRKEVVDNAKKAEK